MKINHGLCVVLALLSVLTSTAGAEAEYYAIFADGKKIGHAVQTRTASKDIVTTIVKTEMTITRMGVPMTIRTSETHVETPTGKPISFESVQDMGAMGQNISGKIRPDGKMDVITTSMGQSRRQTMDFPDGALMSAGLELLERKHGLTEGTTYSLKAFMGSMLAAIDARTTIGAKEKVDLLGRVMTLTKIETVLNTPMGQITSTSYIDDTYIARKTVEPLLGMTMEMISCNKAFALSKNDLVDFLDKMLIQSPVPASTVTSAKSATYHLTPVGRDKLGKFVETDSQKVKPDGKGGLFITVAPAKAPAGASFPYKGKDPAALGALKPGRYVESDDKKVIELAKKAIGDTKDAAVAARKIEKFVDEHIDEKTLSVGYATAAEVAASKQGDCSEHAVLTAAMCRAVGIPARIVCGYVLIPEFGARKDVFGGHAWTEAYVSGKWIGLDGTRLKISPAHLAQAVSNGDPTGFFDVLNTLGYVKISKITVKK